MDDFTFETEKAKRAAREFVDAVAQWEEDSSEQNEAKMVALGAATNFALADWCKRAHPSLRRP
jgi:inosine-uridine nucleoside N-ribohydrolase